MSFIFPRGGLWWLPPAFEYEVSDYKITSLLKKATKIHLDRPLDVSDKKNEYTPELKTNGKVKDECTLEETMQMYRNSIMHEIMEAIRKDCEEDE